MSLHVMPGLVPGIHVFKTSCKQARTWMAGSADKCTAMTKQTHPERRTDQAPCSPKPQPTTSSTAISAGTFPTRFNMATACCDRHADGTGRLALVYVDEDGATTRTSFDEVAEASRRFANVLKADGLVARRPRRGVPVAIAGIADRPSRGVPLRHDLDPAVCAVRRGRAGIPPVEFGGQGHRHR